MLCRVLGDNGDGGVSGSEQKVTGGFGGSCDTVVGDSSDSASSVGDLGDSDKSDCVGRL